MRKLLLALPIAALALSACTPTDQSTVTGSLAGAAVGAAVSSKKDRTEGALIGAAVGAIAGNYIGRANEPGKCVYENQYGERYVAAC